MGFMSVCVSSLTVFDNFLSSIDQRAPSRTLLFPLQLQNMLILMRAEVDNQVFEIMALAISRLLFRVSQILLGTLGFCYVLTYDSLVTSLRFR